MLDRGGWRFMGYFLRAQSGRTALTAGMLIVSGLAEGVGVLALLPLLEVALDSGLNREPSPVAAAVEGALGSVGLEPALGTLLVLIVMAMTLKGVALWLAMRQVGYAAARVAAEFRSRLIRALIRARWSHVASRSLGHYVTTIGMEVQEASWAFREACAALAGLIQVLIYLAIAWTVSWPVALGAIAVGTTTLLVTHGFVRRTRVAGQAQVGGMRQLTSWMGELLPGIKPVKAMARGEPFRRLLDREIAGFEDAERRTVLAQETLRSLREPIFVAVMAVGLYLALGVLQMALASVALLAVVFYRVMFSLGVLQSRYQGMTVGEAAFWSLQTHIRDAESAAETRHLEQATPLLETGLTLEDASLGYGDTPVIEHVSLEIPAGDFVTLIGPSGGGKTTLVDSLAGLVSPFCGRICADGCDLREIDLPAWRSKIGYVPQDPLLFHDTVENNVSLGEASAKRTDVEQALTAAGAMDFVAAFTDGVEHVIAPRGSNLSGGQRQRLAIARALLHRPRLLILDEATTALDPDAEAAICRTLESLRGTLTIVAISHQPMMRRTADAVYEVAGRQVKAVAGTPMQRFAAWRPAAAGTILE